MKKIGLLILLAALLGLMTSYAHRFRRGPRPWFQPHR